MFATIEIGDKLSPGCKYLTMGSETEFIYDRAIR